jgi:hypothetical protein
MLLLRVHAGPHPRRACPACVFIDLDAAQPVTLYQEPGHRPRFCQLEASSMGTRLWWMLPRLDAGQSMEYRLVPMLSRKKPAARVRWHMAEEGRRQLTLDSEPFARFDERPDQPFPGLRAIHAASESPAIAAVRLSADNLKPAHTQTRLKKMVEAVAGPVFGRLFAEGVWLGPRAAQILEEFTLYTFYATPADVRLLDVEIRLRASFGPVSFAPGGVLEVQLEPDFAKDSLLLRNSTGAIGRDQTEGRPAAWIQAAGRGCVALFDHPDNRGSPCCWTVGECSLHARAFDEPHTLAAGEVLALRYRLCLQAGDDAGEGARQHYLDYAHPPRVELIDLAQE